MLALFPRFSQNVPSPMSNMSKRSLPVFGTTPTDTPDLFSHCKPEPEPGSQPGTLVSRLYKGQLKSATYLCHIGQLPMYGHKFLATFWERKNTPEQRKLLFLLERTMYKLRPDEKFERQAVQIFLGMSGVNLTVVTLALIYLERFLNQKEKIKQHLFVSADDREYTLTANGLLLTALLLASKYHYDFSSNSLTNWAYITGASTQLLAGFERTGLSLLDYRLHVSPEEYFQWAKNYGLECVDLYPNNTFQQDYSQS